MLNTRKNTIVLAEELAMVREGIARLCEANGCFQVTGQCSDGVSALDMLERLLVTITDEGEGFEPAELPDPLSEENLLRQSGRGLLLIKAFVDEFEMRKTPALGTEVRLVFYRSEAI